MRAERGAVAEKAKAQRKPGAMREHRRILGQAPSGEYPLDEEGVWETWSWTPSPEWERDNP